uniref:Capsid protein n=1 Tax=Red panda feces-associated gemycircularvirus TaxID=2864013 RepID=A0A8K1HKP0_9VIRU|nr:capsid protein [Red panda feces-associated gemycircularvirus]
MAYRTLRRGRRAYTRKATRSTGRKFGGTRLRRKYPTRKRRYPRKMSNKRILNITSKKKKDTMKTWTNMDANNTTGSYRNGPAYMQGNNIYIIPWAATARPALSQIGSHGSPIEEAVRTSTTCYMRGISETLNVITSTGAPWKWRRICFKLRGDFLYSRETDGTRISLQTPDFGVVRTVTDWGRTPGAVNSLFEYLFRGDRNVDWVDPMIAPTDNRRWDIVYDKTTNIQSPNESGVYRTYRRWHGMNKNLVYDDDQAGQDEELRRWSVEGKQGMGDYYILDMFAGSGGDDDDLSVSYNSTLYWHEK